MFFSSVRVPSVVSPILRMLTLASQRKLPCSRLPSFTPMNIRISRRRFRYSAASAPERQIGLADDLDERRASAVQIDDGVVAEAVHVLAGVLFHVDAEDPRPPPPRLGLDLEHAVPGERLDRTG